MRIRHLLMFSPGRHLSNGSVQFVTRRTTLMIACAAAAAAAAIALAAGAAIGIHWAEHRAAESQGANGVERTYVVDELGKLNASLAQMEPRIARLTTHMGELRSLQARLKAPKPLSKAGTDRGSSRDGVGGPALPPRQCAETTTAASKAEVDDTRAQLACIAQTLEQLEQEAIMHTVAWSALPGRLPVRGGRFGSPFGNRLDPFDRRLSFHSGIDIAAQTGTPILATAGGRVVFSGQKPGYGQVVEIDHGNQLVTRYGHASRLIVREGDLVLPKQHIADVGSTGRSTGPHLHFEVLENGEPMDPAHYLTLFVEGKHG
ncbi:M23 family metallopeptidase [Variovorax sp. J2P1-59]|uniref:M23 family metallopeptidase n=1 Tax=Variovorax flavidus TaxID=3053501 RepID=UPI00257517BC|nr:M23 family metallopeptidase [Variovorax sp. J2P1-59]MDM0078342.1 M23 family metallopeptidase [Variovorax sp. J2P1-59]